MTLDLIQILAPLAIGATGAGITEAIRARRRLRQAEVDDAGATTRNRDELHARLAEPLLEQMAEQVKGLQARVDLLQTQLAAEAAECAKRVATLEAQLEFTGRELTRAEARIRHLEDTRG